MPALGAPFDGLYVTLIPDAVIAVDEVQGIVFFNERAEAIFGYRAAEVLGRPLDVLLPPRYVAAHREHVRAFAASPEQARTMNARGEVAGLRKDGHEFPAEASIVKATWRGRTVLTVILRDVSERKASEEALRRSEARARALIRDAAYGIYRSTPDGRFLEVNPALVRMLGYGSEEELLAVDVRSLYLDPADRDAIVARLTTEERIEGLELTWRRKDGRPCVVRVSGRMVRDPTGAWFESIAEDVTEQRRLEDQLRQAQKMEAVGRLAGGIAHDFNNLLTVIIGRARLLEARLGAGHSDRATVELIVRTAERAASLTRQLLAFGRRQVLQRKPLDLNVVVRDLATLLQRLIGEHIELAMSLVPDLGVVNADRSQLEQVILNLALNARDAMPQGGRLTVTTANVEAAAPHVTIQVSDTGLGMDAETLPRVFEPFFTTKGLGKGTGLGLATVYGIVKQHGGDVTVESDPGRGTTFTVRLPSVPGPAAPERERAEARASGGTETILLVEDDPEVRRLAVEILEAAGYTVLAAADPDEASRIAAGHAGVIDLVVTDVVMPGASGLELAQRIAGDRPEVRVLFMSGYPDRAPIEENIEQHVATFLQKPFTEESLLRSVRAALGDPF